MEAAHVWPFILKITFKKIKHQFFFRLIFWLLDWSVNFLSIYCGYTSRLLNFNIPPSELMTLFSPALVSTLSGETSLYSPQFVEHRYKQHSLTQDKCSQRPWLFPVIWNCFLLVRFGSFSTLVEQANEVSLYLQNTQVDAPVSTLSS